MTIESVDIVVTSDTYPSTPLEGVVVRVFDGTGTTFVTQGITDSNGVASFSLTAPVEYQVRFWKTRVSFSQPARIAVLEYVTNVFDVSAHVYSPPEATHPRMCRCSGFFKKPDGSPAVGHVLHVIPKFDPILFEGDPMLTERLIKCTDESGYMQVDLVRFGQYDVTVEGQEDYERVITIPDSPSVNLGDLMFPVVTRIYLSPEGPYSIGIGVENEVQVVPTVYTSDGRTLPGTALEDVRWSSTDTTVLAVLANTGSITLRGLAAGSAHISAERLDQSIIRIPNTAVAGVPVLVTVA